MKLIRVFPRKTKATPDDEDVRFGPPGLLDEADKIDISVAFSWDKERAEQLAEQWQQVATVELGGPAYEANQPYVMNFEAGRYIKRGYTFTSRGCPRRCWFCGVWKRLNAAIPIPDYPPGWNILDDNLLACPREHVEAVFAMLKTQRKADWPGWDGRIEFTGGLEALALEDYQVGLLADLRPWPNMFFAYDPGDAFETLDSAARRLLAAGFTRESHRMRCYALIGDMKDTFESAEARLQSMKDIGFTPFAMLWKPSKPAEMKYARGDDWQRFAREWLRPAIIHSGPGVSDSEGILF